MTRSNRKLPQPAIGRAPIIGVAGWKKSGKTTLTVRLVEEFTRRGLKVATIKHAHHAFQIDDGETDSARHRRAGAKQVAIVSGARWAMVTELDGAPEPNFEEVVAALEPADLVIVEGYKSAAIPKIEARREMSFTRRSLADEDPNVIAIAADHAVEHPVLPVFTLDDIAGIADLIDRTIGPLQGRVAQAEAEATARLDVDGGAAALASSREGRHGAEVAARDVQDGLHAEVQPGVARAPRPAGGGDETPEN